MPLTEGELSMRQRVAVALYTAVILLIPDARKLPAKETM